MREGVPHERPAEKTWLERKALRRAGRMQTANRPKASADNNHPRETTVPTAKSAKVATSTTRTRSETKEATEDQTEIHANSGTPRSNGVNTKTKANDQCATSRHPNQRARRKPRSTAEKSGQVRHPQPKRRKYNRRKTKMQINCGAEQGLQRKGGGGTTCRGVSLWRDGPSVPLTRGGRREGRDKKPKTNLSPSATDPPLHNAPSPTLPAPKAERHAAIPAQKAIPAKMHPSVPLSPAR